MKDLGDTNQTARSYKAERACVNTVQSPCPVYRKCGGCQLQNMSYEEQLKWKQKRCSALLGSFGEVKPILAMEHPYHYRNKVQAAFGVDRSGRVISGVYQSSTHRIVPINSCQIEDQTADRIIVEIRSMLKSFKLTAYDERKGRGFLRHVLVKRGFATGEIMVVLVTGTPIFPHKKHFISALLKTFPCITTIIQSINQGDTSLVLGEQEQVLFGKGFITDVLCGCRFRISAKSFYQINPLQTEKLYCKAMELADLSGTELVLDAYCGIGTIGMIAARSAKNVVGVELNRNAVRDAIVNARENDIKNIYFHCADAGAFMTAMAEEGESADVLFMDPPRAGASGAFIRQALKLAPKRIVYISCNPETLARDLALFNTRYSVSEIHPVDMFPHTNHVETVCLLSKLHADQHIEVELKMDEMDLTAAESKATYEEIKAYVKEQAGLQVSNLYIAQVKQKCDIIERVNYNLPKSENSRQPKCPPEKEAAIREALEHFHMI